MTVRAPGARISLLCLLVVAAVAVATPIQGRSRSQPRLLSIVQSGRTHAPERPARVVLRRQPPEHAAAEASPRPPQRPWWVWLLLGRLHPTVVHFPIALLTVTALVELLHIAKRKPVPSEAGTYCLAFGVAGALAAVCLGTLNAAHQSVTGEAAVDLERHQVMGWISMIAAASALATGQLARRARQFRIVAIYVGLVLATSAVVGATGHLGAGLVYGDDYISGVLPWNQKAAAVPATAADAALAGPAKPSTSPPEPAVKSNQPTTTTATAAPRQVVPRPAPTASRPAAAAVPGHDAEMAEGRPAAPAAIAQADAVDFTRDVMPILKSTCVECHGPDKVKARLRMDSIEGLQKGGKNGALVKPGDPENSLMMRRVLGLDGEDQMPLDKDPLTEKQIDTLRRWIAAGAVYPAAGSQ